MTFTATLTGAAERPDPVTTTATGTAFVTVDAAGNLVVTGTFAGLTSTANNAHIHGPATVNQAAPVLIPLSFTAATSGTISFAGQITAPQRAEIISGMTYINVHSVNFPMGEIRGQLQ
jgi:hypothetical protein